MVAINDGIIACYVKLMPVEKRACREGAGLGYNSGYLSLLGHSRSHHLVSAV